MNWSEYNLGRLGILDNNSIVPNLQDLDVGDHDLDGSEMEGSLLKAVRTKCVIQLLLLGALDSLQVRIPSISSLNCLLQ